MGIKYNCVAFLSYFYKRIPLAVSIILKLLAVVLGRLASINKRFYVVAFYDEGDCP
jgi:hypothetical protein